jgi:hypothetical protein
MRRVAWGGELVLAGVIAVCGCGWASAQTASTEQPTDRFLWFGGVDGWRNGGFGHGGLLWSPDGLDRAGFVAKFLVGGGSYRYLNGATDTTGTVVLFDAMPGWRFKRDNLEVTVFAGLDLQSHRLNPDDINNRSRGGHAGLRVGTDVWWEPTATTMASLGASLTTIGDGYWSRLAYGWRVFDRVYLGPELHALGDDTYRQWRVGLHATALKIGPYEWSMGVGYVEDNDHRSGLYGRIGLLMRH